MRVLLVEDSARVGEAVSAALRARGWTVATARSRKEADEATSAQFFDVAVVDVGLPDGSGLEWCAAARRSGTQTPILILTARTQVRDRVAGLEAGADDYLGKPFAMDELAARVIALSRRGPHWLAPVRLYGRLRMDRDRRLVSVDGEPLALTPRELDVVLLLAWRDGRVVTRDDLLDAVWGEATERAAASLEVLVARIRRKLADAGIRDALRTARQHGYAWSLERSNEG